MLHVDKDEHDAATADIPFQEIPHYIDSYTKDNLDGIRIAVIYA
jgi:hypothetical protein